MTQRPRSRLFRLLQNNSSLTAEAVAREFHHLCLTNHQIRWSPRNFYLESKGIGNVNNINQFIILPTNQDSGQYSEQQASHHISIRIPTRMRPIEIIPDIASEQHPGLLRGHLFAELNKDTQGNILQSFQDVSTRCNPERNFNVLNQHTQRQPFHLLLRPDSTSEIHTVEDHEVPALPHLMPQYFNESFRLPQVPPIEPEQIPYPGYPPPVTGSNPHFGTYEQSHDPDYFKVNFPTLSHNSVASPISSISSAQNTFNFRSPQTTAVPEIYNQYRNTIQASSKHLPSNASPTSLPNESPSSCFEVVKLQRSSLKTCELDEVELAFPGCYVLVPTSEDDPPASDANAICKEGSTARLTSTKKSFRKPMGDRERALVKLNRKFGVCLRCKMFKERCRGGFPCERCRGLKIWKNICVTAHFADKAVFSRGLWENRVRPLMDNILKWSPQTSTNNQVIEVSNGFGPKLSLTVHSFDPVDSAMLEHIIWRELRKTDFNRFPSTAYGIYNKLSREAIDKYLDQHIPFLLNWILEKEGQTIYTETLNTAYQYTLSESEKTGLVRQALRIWVAQALYFKGAWRIIGSNTIGMHAINDSSSMLHRITPLPRLLNQQLDAMIETRMMELEQVILNELQVRIFKKNPAEWFVIYLTLFTFLCGLEKDCWGLKTWDVNSQDLLHKVETLELKNPSEARKAWTWPLQEKPSVLADKNDHLACILAAHFRSVTKGHAPFKLDWNTDSVVAMAGNDKAAVQYMRKYGEWVTASETMLQQKLSAPYERDNYESLDLIFTSKLMVGSDNG
ncbi:hypothetical protein RUND412_001468 [Rhizina undulata]